MEFILFSLIFWSILVKYRNVIFFHQQFLHSDFISGHFEINVFCIFFRIYAVFMALYIRNRDTQLSAMAFFFIEIKFSHLWKKIFPHWVPIQSIQVLILKLMFIATFSGLIGFSGPVYVKMRKITWLCHLAIAFSY